MNSEEVENVKSIVQFNWRRFFVLLVCCFFFACFKIQLNAHDEEGERRRDSIVEIRMNLLKQ